MPKVTKNLVAKKGGGGAAKKNKLYSMPEKIPEGTVMTDTLKRQWKVGKSIGLGGFGEIYSACLVGESNYDYVLKCEPSENGPLFVEFHFYMRNGRQEHLDAYKKKINLKFLGMPHMIANGNHSLNGKSHRYIVMPRYGPSVEYYFLANGRRLPTGTVYRLALQMLDVYEYLNHCGYVHGDLKGANILMGLGKSGAAQAYLIDFGLAARFFIDRDYKPDPKKAHNGTIEYTSRDAHNGVPTTRGDLEILGYNLIHWLGAELPWVRDKLLATPTKVQASKEKFMSNLSAELSKEFPQGVPGPLTEYMNYVAKLKYNDHTDFKKLRKIFQDGLKALKISDSGDLDMNMKNQKSKALSPTTKRNVQKKRPVTTKAQSSEEDDDDESDDEEGQRNASDDDDDDVVFMEKPNKRIAKPGTLKSVVTPVKNKDKQSPRKVTPNSASPRKRPSLRAKTATSPSPIRKKMKNISPSTAKRATGYFSPKITIGSRHGSTVVNNNVTPNPRANKTYEFNVELNVSMDADVVVNVKRKKKTTNNGAAASPKGTSKSSSKASNGTPGGTRVQVHKVNSEIEEIGSSPHTPVVRIMKTRHGSGKRNQ